MFEDDNEEREFWSNVPDSRFDRLRSARAPRQPRPKGQSRPTRTHLAEPRDTAAVAPVPITTQINVVPRPGPGGRSGRTAPIDPLLRRMGVLGVTVVLLVPVAMALRAQAEGAPTRVQPQTTTLATGAAPAALAAPAERALADNADPSTIDINALPQAIPDNTAASVAATRKPQVANVTRVAKVAKAAPTTVARAATVKKVAVACTRYTVVKGDAWSSIASRAKVRLAALLAANHAVSTTAIFPGRSICLPAGAAMPVTKSTPAKSGTPKAGSTTPTTIRQVLPTPPPNTYTPQQVAQIIRDVWPDDLEDHAIAIASRESHLNPSARNFCCYGLFQIYYTVHRTWLGQMGITNATQLWDPKLNAEAAYVLYQRWGGFGPWGG